MKAESIELKQVVEEKTRPLLKIIQEQDERILHLDARILAMSETIEKLQERFISLGVKVESNIFEKDEKFHDLLQLLPLLMYKKTRGRRKIRQKINK